MRSLEDRVLLRALGKGSSRAFDALYRKYAPKVRAFSLAMLKDTDTSLADDLVQNVFLKLWENREQMANAVKDIDAYLFITTKNAVLNILARNRTSAWEPGAGAESMSDEQMSLIISRDIQDIIDKTLRSMPGQRRLVFRMSRVEGLSHKEIAAKLGISVKTVEYHICKAISDIRKNLN